MAASKTRKRSPHSGVVLLRPTGRRVSWRARFDDPDTGKRSFESLDPLALRTATARRDWAIRKAEALAKRRLELKGGAARKLGTPIADGVKAYFAARKSLRDRTKEDYRSCTDAFQEWATGARIDTLDKVTKPKLLEYRDWVINKPHTRAKGKDTRSDYTINRILRGTGVVLRWLLERGKLPSCSSDDLSAGLKRVRASIDRVAFLGRGEPAALLRAMLDHDKATFRATRAELKGKNPVGTTPRHELISPFTLALLLSGMRFSECLELEWSQVDLKALGHDGKPSGELYLRAQNVKTKRGREVAFDVSPSLLALFDALPKDDKRVFSWLGRDVLEAARKRLKLQGAAPVFDWQSLRRTCGSFLTNAPGIFGAAAAFHSAKRLGHSVAVAEKHYLGTVKGIPHEARTIEQAMGVETEADAVIKLVRERFGAKAVA